MADDPYGSLHYRSVIDWPQRLAREWPLLEAVFGVAPVRRLLDLGCGTGDHARFLAEHGFDVVGIDASPAMLEQARASATPGVTFLEGDISEAARLVQGVFGGALCLGNTLPHIADEEALGRLAAGLRVLLAPGAGFILQILNYELVFARRQRYLPPTFRQEEGEERVFLRLMDPQPDGRTVIFCPSTFRYRATADPPLELLGSRRVVLRGWRRREVDAALEQAGFRERQPFGGFDRRPYDPATSPDLILVCR